MKYFIITDTGVRVFNSYNRLTNEIDVSKAELTQVGTDYVGNMTDQSFDISRDIKMLENVASRNVFKTESVNWNIVLTVVVIIILLIKH